MTTYIPARINEPIDIDVVAPGRPTAGRTAGLIANDVNFLNHNKFMREYHIPIENVAPSGTTYDPSDTGRAAISYFRFYNSPTALRLFIGIWHMAVLEEKGDPSYLTVGLYKTDGTLIQSRTWDPTELHQVGVRLTLGGSFPPDLGYLSTGWDADAFDITNYRGEELEIRLLQAGCRIFGCDIIEIYEGEIS